MQITNNTIVNVCSYMPVTIVASTNVEDYVFEPCMTDNPIIIPMSAVEVKEIHSKSKIFADGWLTFEADVEDEMYQYLKIKNGNEILNQIEIMNCIVSGNKEDVEKLINITSKGYFERVYGVYVALKQSNMYDISMRVAKALEYRYKELQRGIVNTQIKLSDSVKRDKQNESMQEKDALLQESQQKIATLEKQIQELMSAMSQLSPSNQPTTTASVAMHNTAPKAKRGRPSIKK